MALRSQIAALIANQLGNIEGQLEARIQTETVKLLSKFSNRCPDNKELIKIVKASNNMLRVVNTFQKKVNKFSSIPRKLRRPIRAANRLIRLLKRNRTKLARGARPSYSDYDRGGLFSVKTAGYTTSQADRLVKVRLLLDDLEDDLQACNSLLQGVVPSFDNIRELLSGVNDNIEECAQVLEEEQEAELKELLLAVQPLENTGSEGTPDEDYNYIAANGRKYTLAIIDDNSIDSLAKRRLAVAKDNIGVIVLRGQPSFSSDTKILLDELKFRLDNQLA